MRRCVIMYDSRVVLYCGLGFLGVIFRNAAGQLSEDSLKTLAEQLGSRLHRITKEASGFETIEKGFADLKPRLDDTDPAEALKRIREKLAKSVQDKIVAVTRLVDFAEETAKGHRWNPMINISYPSAKEPDSNASGFEPIDFSRDSRFYNDVVNVHSSTIHVPTNVFARVTPGRDFDTILVGGDPTENFCREFDFIGVEPVLPLASRGKAVVSHHATVVQYGMWWSRRLDHMFRYNFDNDPTLKSQHFTSSAGFTRMYPGVRWINSRDPEKPDMYDARLSNWYIRASSSPKDIIILLDISGSMTGRRRDTARRTAVEIMNTLNEDDFFNILTFKDDVDFLDSCCNGTLVQATDFVKQRFAKLLIGLETTKYANYTVALPVAFEVVQQNISGRTASCNQAIMIISDNAPDIFEDICLKYNPERQVRIFAYVIGREVTEYEYMTELACNNRGYVAHIVTMADVRDYVEAYYQVLGRPMVLYKNHTNVWTSAYWHYRNVLGMVITVAQPVFNRSAAAGSKGSMLGVMGLDIPTDDIIKAMAPHKWGVSSYVFAVNHNGRVIFHPQWKFQANTEGFSVPRIPELDISDVETVANKTDGSSQYDMRLRFEMIDQAIGNHTMQILRKLDNGRRVYIRDYQYHYVGIAGSPFSIALALPLGIGRSRSSKTVLHGIRRPRESDSAVFDNTAWIIHPDWYYCNITSSRFPSMAQYLEDILVKGDKELLESFMFDAKATYAVGNEWGKSRKAKVDMFSLYGIITCFVSTRAGLTRWKEMEVDDERQDPTGPVAADVAYVDDFVGNASESLTKHYFQVYSRAVDESFYERTVITGAELTITAMLNSDETDYTNISSDFFMASMPVFVGDEDQDGISVAVAGILMRTSGLTNLLLQLSRASCNGSSNCFSCHSPSVTCYLLDESGYVVADTQYSENTGKFYGILQGEVMQALVGRGIYKQFPVNDNQGLCQAIRKEKSAGAFTRPWIFGAFRNVEAFAKLLWGYVILWIDETLATEDYYQYENPDRNNTTVDLLPPLPPFPCDTESVLFQSTWSELKTVFHLDCLSNCSKQVGVFRVSLTNMLLVALDTPRSCWCDDVRITTEPREVIFTKEQECSRLAETPYRKAPRDCFAYFKEEDASECGRPWGTSLASVFHISSALFPLWPLLLAMPFRMNFV